MMGTPAAGAAILPPHSVALVLLQATIFLMTSMRSMRTLCHPGRLATVVAALQSLSTLVR